MPQGSTFFVPGPGEFAISKTFPGGSSGGLSDLEFTENITALYKTEVY